MQGRAQRLSQGPLLNGEKHWTLSLSLKRSASDRAESPATQALLNKRIKGMRNRDEIAESVMMLMLEKDPKWALDPKPLAARAYAIADAMQVEREKRWPAPLQEIGKG